MEALKQVVNESAASKTIFKALSKRVRFRRHTDIRFFQYQLQTVTKEEILHTFKRLEMLGLGTIVYGRGKNPDKFLWAYNLKDVTKVAQGKMELEECQRLTASSSAPAPKRVEDKTEAILKLLKLILD